MSNKTQLQTNNTKYASLIDTLRGKSLPTGGEDVTTETNAYTTKLASLETAISALETELEGKASGGGNIETCTVNIVLGGIRARSLSATTYIDGNIAVYYLLDSGSITINNVVCGSAIALEFVTGVLGQIGGLTTVTCDGDIEMMYDSMYNSMTLRAPRTANSSATFDLYYD